MRPRHLIFSVINGASVMPNPLNRTCCWLLWPIEDGLGQGVCVHMWFGLWMYAGLWAFGPPALVAGSALAAGAARLGLCAGSCVVLSG